MIIYIPPQILMFYYWVSKYDFANIYQILDPKLMMILHYKVIIVSGESWLQTSNLRDLTVFVPRV